MLTYDWRFDSRCDAYRLTVTRGDRWAVALIDPRPFTKEEFLADIAMALTEATKVATTG